MKFSRRSLFGSLIAVPLVSMATANESVVKRRPTDPRLYNMQKVRDIVDMLAAQLIQKFEEDGIRYPADHTTPSGRLSGRGRSRRLVPLTDLTLRIDQIINHEEWCRMQDSLSSTVKRYDGAEASNCKVLVYTLTGIPNDLIFEFRAFKFEDQWPKPDSLLYYRHVRVAT